MIFHNFQWISHIWGEIPENNDVTYLFRFPSFGQQIQSLFQVAFEVNPGKMPTFQVKCLKYHGNRVISRNSMDLLCFSRNSRIFTHANPIPTTFLKQKGQRFVEIHEIMPRIAEMTDSGPQNTNYFTTFSTTFAKIHKVHYISVNPLKPKLEENSEKHC